VRKEEPTVVMEWLGASGDKKEKEKAVIQIIPRKRVEEYGMNTCHNLINNHELATWMRFLKQHV
jgi:hypothetical protein